MQVERTLISYRCSPLGVVLVYTFLRRRSPWQAQGRTRGSGRMPSTNEDAIHFPLNDRGLSHIVYCRINDGRAQTRDHSSNAETPAAVAALRKTRTKQFQAELGDAPDFVEVGEAGIAVDHAMRR